MTVTSVKSMKYLHSTAHEALDVWQLHTEDETPPTLHVWNWELTGPYLATVHWFKGQQRQQAVTSEDTEHYDLEAHYDVIPVCTTPPPPRWPHHPRMAGPADTKWGQMFILWRRPTPRGSL